MSHVFDFLVVGAGMAGVSVADALAPDARVALLESEPHPGYHSTARSAALFSPSYGSALFTVLTRASTSFFLDPPPTHFRSPLVQPRGALHLARADQRGRLEELIAAVQAAGGHIEALSASAARRYLPVLREEYAAAAAYEDGVFDIDVEALFRGFLNRSRAAGAQLFLGTPFSSAQRRGEFWELEVAGTALRARVLVNAAGAWADQVGRACGAQPLGLAALRRSAALIEAPPGVDVARWPAVFDMDDAFYLKPDAGRLLISPAEEEPVPPGDAYPEDLTIALAVERIEAALTLEIKRVQRSWAGLRTFAPDREPVIGYDPQVPGLFWFAGQGGYGIQSAPAAAQLAAALARGAPVPPELAAFGMSAAAVAPRRLHRG